jgi:hypothetical protein
LLGAGEDASAGADGGLDLEGARRPGLGLAGGEEEERRECEEKDQRAHEEPP